MDTIKIEKGTWLQVHASRFSGRSKIVDVGWVGRRIYHHIKAKTEGLTRISLHDTPIQKIEIYDKCVDDKFEELEYMALFVDKQGNIRLFNLIPEHYTAHATTICVTMALKHIPAPEIIPEELLKIELGIYAHLFRLSRIFK